MTDKDTELVHEEVNDETINNIVTEHNEPIIEILLREKNFNK